jgi:magnesium chelatase family protein
LALAAATNPCPCGHRGDPRRECRCAPEQIARYWSKISGPILDRIDLVVETRAPSLEELLASPSGETSAVVRARVIAARRAAELRVQRAEMVTWRDRELCPAVRALLGQAEKRFALSARGLARVRPVAGTIADINGSREIEVVHVAEALRYRIPPRE